MVRQEFHLRDFEVVAQLMDFEARLVVDVDVLLLCDGEEGLVVQPANRSTSFS